MTIIVPEPKLSAEEEFARRRAEGWLRPHPMLPDENGSKSHNCYKYHLEMVLSELVMAMPGAGDTRVYLSLDRVEARVIEDLLRAELGSVHRTLTIRE